MEDLLQKDLDDLLQKDLQKDHYLSSSAQLDGGTNSPSYEGRSRLCGDFIQTQRLTHLPTEEKLKDNLQINHYLSSSFQCDGGTSYGGGRGGSDGVSICCIGLIIFLIVVFIISLIGIIYDRIIAPHFP
ncbi:MAG: hypothetical protein E4G89_00145 [Methanothrix sp.]|nr:MAG: hypothetical protein E4G89_00145 [Methanothrix sp.]